MGVEELLELLASRRQVVTVALLAEELESVFGPARGRRICRRDWDDRNLIVSANAIDDTAKVARVAERGNIGVLGDDEECFEGNVLEDHGGGDVHLGFRSKDSHDVRCELLVGETDRRVGLLLDVVDEDVFLAQKRTVIAARNV